MWIPRRHNPRVKLFLDTETRVSFDKHYQALIFGQCLVEERFPDRVKRTWFLFYSDEVTEPERKVLEKFRGRAVIMHVKDFVEKVFVPYALDERAEIVGFNLPFDLARLSEREEGLEEGFLYHLPGKCPPIYVKSIGNKRAIIRFVADYEGYFLDLKTLGFAITNKQFSLRSACLDFGIKQGKTEAESHGVITSKYVKYNHRDVIATRNLYYAMMKRYRLFGVSAPPNTLKSPASIGKAYLRERGIRPFMLNKRNMDNDALGKIMSTFHGGRTECRIRKRNVEVTYLDFTSMYPSVHTLMRLEDFDRADHVEYRENTENVRRFVESVTLEDLLKKETWAREEMRSVVCVLPRGDILPMRVKEDGAIREMIPLVDSSPPLWFTIQDVLASKVLTGKAPTILEAITVYPMGIRHDLNPIKIAGVPVNPEDDFIETLSL